MFTLRGRWRAVARLISLRVGLPNRSTPWGSAGCDQPLTEIALMTAGIRLAIATPCFGGHVSTLYAASIFKLQRALRGIPEIELAIQLRDGTP